MPESTRRELEMKYKVGSGKDLENGRGAVAEGKDEKKGGKGRIVKGNTRESKEAQAKDTNNNLRVKLGDSANGGKFSTFGALDAPGSRFQNRNVQRLPSAFQQIEDKKNEISNRKVETKEAQKRKSGQGRELLASNMKINVTSPQDQEPVPENK